MTSAIPDMSVAEVRKALGEVRKRAQTQTLTHPMHITDDLTANMSVQEFCLKFVCGHHDKRHNKGKRTSTAGAGAKDQQEDADYNDDEDEEANDEHNDDDDDGDDDSKTARVNRVRRRAK